jgi:hypothetical protein
MNVEQSQPSRKGRFRDCMRRLLGDSPVNATPLPLIDASRLAADSSKKYADSPKSQIQPTLVAAQGQSGSRLYGATEEFCVAAAVFEAQQRNLLMVPNPPQTDIKSVINAPRRRPLASP